jgi:hypothetical protein
MAEPAVAPGPERRHIFTAKGKKIPSRMGEGICVGGTFLSATGRVFSSTAARDYPAGEQTRTPAVRKSLNIAGSIL